MWKTVVAHRIAEPNAGQRRSRMPRPLRAAALAAADGSAKLAVLHVLTGAPIAACEEMLAKRQGRLKETLRAARKEPLA